MKYFNRRIKKGLSLLLVAALLTACQPQRDSQEMSSEKGEPAVKLIESTRDPIQLTDSIQTFEEGLEGIKVSHDMTFEDFIQQGGASSDQEVVNFLSGQLGVSLEDMNWTANPFACSTLATQNDQGDYLFGRNFDWYNCDALIVESRPDKAYASIATVNTDFVSGIDFDQLPDAVKGTLALYAPLDGMNEKGLAISVNMIQTTETIGQNTDKPDLTTTTAVRLILNQAANVDEAIALLKAYDLHASMGYMIHFALSDVSGKQVVVEYVNQEMIVTESPIVTNYYLAEGDHYGIGTRQSHDRFASLENWLNDNPTMDESLVKEALESVSKKHFNDGETTEWSIVFNQTNGNIDYYHRENHDVVYPFTLEGDL